MSRGKRDPETPFLSQTKVAPEKTATEIQELLGRGGARRVMTEYEAGETVGISFSILIEGREVLFRLPVRWRQYLKVLDEAARRKPRRGFKPIEIDPEQARRTAWRVTKAWLEAQLAIIQSGMVDIQEVMLPYVVQGDQTLYERLAGQGFMLIEYKK